MTLVLLLSLQELANALRDTRAETSYEATFTSTLTIGRGDPLKRQGTVQWWKAGALTIDYAGSMNEQVKAVRAGTRVWVHGIPGWLNADEAGKPAVASGFQNPDALLDLLQTHAGAATAVNGGWKIELKGEAAVQAAKKLHPERDFQGREASFTTVLTVLQGRITALEVEAAAATPEGAGSFAASARLARFGAVPVPQRLGKVPFSADVAAAIANQLK